MGTLVWDKVFHCSKTEEKTSREVLWFSVRVGTLRGKKSGQQKCPHWEPVTWEKKGKRLESWNKKGRIPAIKNSVVYRTLEGRSMKNKLLRYFRPIFLGLVAENTKDASRKKNKKTRQNDKRINEDC